MRYAAALVLALALAACAAPRWTKPGVSAAEAASDYSECNALAQEANRRDNEIEADILASRGRDWENESTLVAHTDVWTAEAYHRIDELIRFCMQAKGYAPAR